MRSRLLASLLLAAALLAAAVPADAAPRGAADRAPALMPLDPEVAQSYQAQGLAVPAHRTEARFAGRPRLSVNRVARPTSVAAAAGAAATEVRAIVLLVGFTDTPPGGPEVRFRATVWDSMLFGDVYVRGGADTTTIRTLKRYYRAASYGAVDIVTLDLPGSVGWLTAPHLHEYYCDADNGFGPYPNNVQRLVMDAVIAADPYVDFSRYASGGWVRNLFVVHAGSGAEWSSGDSLIWSHAWSVATDDGFGHTPPALYADGARVGDYSMEPEAGGNTTGEGGAVTGPFLPTVGVYAHEFGHILGLPDEYDYGYESSGTGRFSLMAGGSWNRVPNVYPECAGNSPARPSAWGLVQLGFVTPTVVSEQVTGVTLPPVARHGTGSVLRVDYPGSDGAEYWLFENRQQMDFDEGFARMGADAHGLLVYHVDGNVMERSYWQPNEAECVSGGIYSGLSNCDCDTLAADSSNGERWYGVTLEQADGLYQLELGSSAGAADDFYPGTTAATSFTPSTTPNTSSYYRYGGCTGFAAATNIVEAAGDITLDLTADVRTHTLTVTVDGDGSVQFDPERAVYQHGSTVTLEAVPGPNRTFGGWSGDTTATANPLVLAMYADRSLTATFVGAAAVGDGAVPALALAAPRPSPVRGTAEIAFSLPREMAVRLGILDLQGREIAVLAEGVMAAGPHAAIWDGRTERGAAAPGLYFARLAADGRVLSQRLVRLR